MNNSTSSNERYATRTRHGHSRRSGNSKVYRTWSSMLRRCHTSTSTSYPDYGGRGITVCARWRFGECDVPAFECFLADMGEPPTSKHSIERKEYNGNYDKDNCIWLLRCEQSRNKRDNRWLTAFGKTQLMADWARDAGIKASVICIRLRRGWPVEEAVQRDTPEHRSKMSRSKGRKPL